MQVYFIAGQGYAHTGYFKVGVSKNYQDRISGLYRGVPFELTIQCVIDCIDEYTAKNVEYDILNKFKQNRIKGEWFFAYGRNIQHESIGLSKAVVEYMKSLGHEVLEG